jgi:LEA14-like dessication related protein
MDTLLWIGVGLFAFLAFEKSTVVSNLKFVENGLDFNMSNLLRPQINLHIGVQNPTSGSITLQSVAGSFAVNGVPSGNVSYFVPTVIAPNAQTEIVLHLAVNDAALIADLMNFINNGGKTPVKVDVEVTANINNVPVPVSLSFDALPAYNNLN